MEVPNPGRPRSAAAQGTALNPAMRVGVRCGLPAPLKHFSAPGIHQKPVRLACRRPVPHARSASGKPASPKNLLRGCIARAGPCGRGAARGVDRGPAAGCRSGSAACADYRAAVSVRQPQRSARTLAHDLCKRETWADRTAVSAVCERNISRRFGADLDKWQKKQTTFGDSTSGLVKYAGWTSYARIGLAYESSSHPIAAFASGRGVARRVCRSALKKGASAAMHTC